MKRISYVILLLAAFVSCTKNVQTVSQRSDVVFRVASLDTRAAFDTDQTGLFVSWENADMVGISASRQDEPIGVNYSYMLSSGSESVLEPTSTIYRYEASSEETSYYAYYPYSGEPQSGVHYLAPLTLSDQQAYDPSQPLAHLKENWMMRAEPCVLNSVTSTVDLTFSGVFSIVELKLRYDEPTSKSYPLEKVTLKSAGDPLAVSAGNLRLDTSVSDDPSQSPIIINTGVDSVALALDYTVTLSDTEEDVFYFVVAPGRHEAEELSVILTTDNQYKTQVKIAEGVTFKPNTVYHKSVTIDSEGFVSTKPEGEKEEVTVYVPVSVPDGLTDGEYIMAFEHTDGNTYLLPRAPVSKNPKLVSLADAQVVFDQEGNIISVSEGYLWTFVKNGAVWKFSYVQDDLTYKLIGTNKAQGITISDTLSGSYTTQYYDTWSVTKSDDKVIIQVSEVPTRWFVAYTDTTNGIAQFQNGGQPYGSWKFYKKTTILQ